MTKRMLLVVTSHDRLGETGAKTGFWLEELATPYYAFVDAGVDVTIASPEGGAAPFDPKSAGEAASVRRFQADPVALEKVRNTLPLSRAEGTAWDGIFIAGGHGTMWDLPASQPLARVLGAAFDGGAVVSAVCHGPAGLVAARRRDGRPLVEGKRLTAFTNEEEAAVKLSAVVPFLLQSKLSELGGRFEVGGMWQPHAIRDGQLVTGQNPQSSEKVAHLVLEALGVEGARASVG